MIARSGALFVCAEFALLDEPRFSNGVAYLHYRTPM